MESTASFSHLSPLYTDITTEIIGELILYKTFPGELLLRQM